MYYSCKTCGNRAKFKCKNCKQPICGRCRTRRKKNSSSIVQDLASNYFQPAGLCRDCKDVVILEKALSTTVKLYNFTREIFHQGSLD